MSNITLFLRPDVGRNRLIYSASTNISQHGISSEDLRAHYDSSWVVGRQASPHCLLQHAIVPLDVLKKTGRYDVFKLEWHSSYNDTPNVWPIPNHLFWDSDVAKWMEGACYSLKNQPNAEVDVAVRELVEMIRSAQQPDGYLNIHFTVVEPGRRWTS